MNNPRKFMMCSRNIIAQRILGSVVKSLLADIFGKKMKYFLIPPGDDHLVIATRVLGINFYALVCGNKVSSFVTPKVGNSRFQGLVNKMNSVVFPKFLVMTKRKCLNKRFWRYFATPYVTEL